MRNMGITLARSRKLPGTVARSVDEHPWQIGAEDRHIGTLVMASAGHGEGVILGLALSFMRRASTRVAKAQSAGSHSDSFYKARARRPGPAFAH